MIQRKNDPKRPTKAISELLSRPVITVPEAGMTIFGLSRNGAYEAAKRGDFETIKIGKLIVVPTAPLRKKLGMEAV